MMLIITGTPGTGKTSVTRRLEEKINAKFISINSLLADYDLDLGIDNKRGYKIVDTIKMTSIVDDIIESCEEELIIFEGHIAQDYPHADMVIVLRCNPEVLTKRLSMRDWSEEKIHENVSAEILGVCTSESYESYGHHVQEIETSSVSIDELSDYIIGVINNEMTFGLGEIDYLEDYIRLI